MMRTTWVWLLGTILLCALVACTSGGGGGGDDDDDIDIGGDGDADLDGDSDSDSDGDSDSDSDSDSDGDGDGDYECGPDDPNQDPPENDPLCDAPCENLVEICGGGPGDVDPCIADCGARVRSMEGACLDAYRALTECLTTATECTEEDGAQGCDTQREAAGTACANGCIDILDCMQECAQGDQACLQTCFDNGSPSGQATFGAANECVRTHCGDIPLEDEDCVGQCLDANCIDETRACR